MDGSSFDLIAQGLLRQKQVMEHMEEENRELRRQLAELREGHGISIEIDGHRFSLCSEQTTSSQETAIEVAPVATVEPVTVASEPQAEPVVALHDIASDETEELVMSVPETPHTPVDFFADSEEPEEQTTGPTFLEEVMIDEFASAATSPLAVWSAPVQEQEKKPETNVDEELATLRRQLIGSYLLE